MIFISETRDGDVIRYVDRKRYLWIASVLAPSAPGIGALMVLTTGNFIWSAFGLVFYYLLVPIADILIGEDETNPPESVVEALSSDPWYRSLLFAAIPVYYFSFFASAYVIGTMQPPVWAYLLLAVGAGASSGSAITVGHELGHKPNRLDQLGAKLANGVSGYGHFCIEHNRGHHVMVATPEDHASARYDESVYRFALREIPGVAAHGWRLEAARLAKKGLPFWHWRNDILQGYAIGIAIALVVLVAFGWIMLPFIVINALIGWFHLTMANYVEHYGLKRTMLDNGRLEPCQPHHSWNTNHLISNLMLFHLQRHSDHHANPLRPYQALRDFPELPRLPSGYPGSFLLALIPPLWFAIMNPKVIAWADGDDSRINHG